MMTIKDQKGRRTPVVFAGTNVGNPSEVIILTRDDRALSSIAMDFEGLERMEVLLESGAVRETINALGPVIGVCRSGDHEVIVTIKKEG